MHWKTREILMISFGGVAILAFLGSFLVSDAVLFVLLAGIAVLSFVIAMLLKNMKIKVIKYKYKRRIRK